MTKKIINERMPDFKSFVKDGVSNDPERLIAELRKRNLPVEHSLFATIHHQSDERPDGYTDDDLERINDALHEGDKERWKAQIAAHDNGTDPSEDGTDQDGERSNPSSEGEWDYDDVGTPEEGSGH